MLDGLALKLLIVGGWTTVTVTEFVTVPPVFVADNV
jgi:hypothetical protein